MPGGDLVEVVAYDPGDDVVEIQYFDGALEELDLESWDELAVAPAAPPEDWSGPMDVAREDLGDMDESRGRPMYDGYDYLNDIDELS